MVRKSKDSTYSDMISFSDHNPVTPVLNLLFIILAFSALCNHVGFVQVLKSGEVVYSQLPQQQSGGESKVEPSLMGTATPVKVSREGKVQVGGEGRVQVGDGGLS